MTKKLIAGLFFLLLLAGCAMNEAPSSSLEDGQGNEQTFKPIKLKDLGEAPELHNETWLNTDQPLRLADLRGKVVLLDMWTFG